MQSKNHTGGKPMCSSQWIVSKLKIRNALKRVFFRFDFVHSNLTVCQANLRVGNSITNQNEFRLTRESSSRLILPLNLFLNFVLNSILNIQKSKLRIWTEMISFSCLNSFKSVIVVIRSSKQSETHFSINFSLKHPNRLKHFRWSNSWRDSQNAN